MKTSIISALILFSALFCAPGAPALMIEQGEAPLQGKPPATDIQIIESVPEGVPMDHPDIKNTAEAWIEIINGAKESMDAEEFYISSEKGSKMDEVIRSIMKAAGRGVKTRFIFDTSFYQNSRDGINLLKSSPNIKIGLLDMKKFTGGVMHAKYFIIDEELTFLGSQNFDSKALEQIFELGVLIKSEEFAQRALKVFNHDWNLCLTDTFTSAPAALPVRQEPIILNYYGETASVRLTSAPNALNPEGPDDELAALLGIINGSKDSVYIQVMQYSPKDPYSGVYMDSIDNALRRAAARGVKVRLLVTDWNIKYPDIDYIKSLSVTPNIEVKMIIIPRLKEKFLSFARVCHAKYMVADGENIWIGSSNWQPGYFTSSRNVGAAISGRKIGKDIKRIFLDYWTSEYASGIDPAREYEKPQVSD